MSAARTCPSWCVHVWDDVGEGERNPLDAGVLHVGDAVDEWVVEGGHGQPITARVEGFRHDHASEAEGDWTSIVFDGTDAVQTRLAGTLSPADARRLAAALVMAADQAEGRTGA